MKINEVPQDDENMFEGKTRDLQYAIDEEGHYTTVKSVGWDPKNIVMKQAWDREIAKINEARILVKQGLKSPVYYYMKKCLMDIKLLASYTGFSRFKIRCHFSPKNFKKLTEVQIDQYIYAFGLKNKEDIFNIDE